MEIKVNRLEFLKKIRIVEKAISDNKIKPIISCTYIETENEKLRFYGTDLEITIITEMECEVKEKGAIVFQHQIVEEYLKELQDEYITLKEKELTLIIETADSATEFSLFNPEEFPKNYVINELNMDEPSFDITSEELIGIFEKTKFAGAQSTDDMRINCVKIEANDGIVDFVGTDTYRLVYLQKELVTSKNFSISIPLKTVETTVKLFRNTPTENLNIMVGKKNIKMKTQNITVISRMIDLPFPDYKGILNGLSHDKKLTMKISEFINILKRVTIFVKSNNESKYGALFHLNGDKMLITGSNEVAKINEESKVNYEGNEIKISLNTKFLIDFLNNLQQDSEVEVEFSSSNGSVKITQIEDEKYVYIVMPLAMRG